MASGNFATSVPWAAAVKAAVHQHHHHMGIAANPNPTFVERSTAIGSWCSPETSSSARGGWNADGSMKGDGQPDDGTAIWGNPTSKKTGIDWAEKESLVNPTQANSSTSEKRIQKTEPTISSINGTEAWGAPPPASAAAVSAIGVGASASAAAAAAVAAASLVSKTTSTTNSLQQSKTSENSGNIYGTKTINNEPLGWGDASSSSASSFSLQQQRNNGSSSPPSNNFIWNHLTNNGNQQKPSAEWPSSSSSTSSSNAPASSSRIDELNKQLESTSLFDALSSSPPSSASGAMSSSMAKTLSSSASSGNNTNFEASNCATALGSSALSGGSNSINDLKQMSANFSSNDLIDPSSRPPMMGAMPSQAGPNNSRSQMNAYPLGLTPSRDLLKQMVHQIQLAVQAGHLNAQILNQPMSTPTLQLVYTLLQQIKLLQQFQEVQQRAISKPNDTTTINLPSNLDSQINRVQQNISLLQKAITQQQAALTKNDTLADLTLKQQQQQAAANNFSYANISKLSTNMKVPPSNTSNITANNSIDSFKRSNLIDSLTGHSFSDPQRVAQQQADAIEANETIDKTLNPSLQSSVNNILNNRAASFASGTSANQQQQQQAQKGGMASAQTPISSSSAAWLAFNSSDLVSSSSSSGWPTRISANVSQHGQQQQLNPDLLSEYVNSTRGWRTASDNIAQNSSTSLAPGANINLARPNSASNNLRQLGDTNDILSKDSSPYYDWSSNSDSFKRNYDSAHDSSPVSSLSPPVIGGLSLQSNPWLFAPSVGAGADILLGKNSGNSFGAKHDNRESDKLGGDSFLRSNNVQQRSGSALYDWGNIGSSLQYNTEPAPIGSKQGGSNSNNAGRMPPPTSAIGVSSRPAPPPGLMSNFGSSSSFMGNAGTGSSSGSRSTNEMSSLDKLGKSNDEAQLPSRDSSASLWSGTWFN